MDILLIFLVLCILYKINFNPKGFNSGYISQKQTTAINGIFVILVFIRHFSHYFGVGKYGLMTKYANRYMGQLIVVTFLFYSGYGIMYSIMHKEGYYKTIPSKRFFKVWYHFAFAVVLYIMVSIFLKNVHGPREFCLAFTGWVSIGNSNWYVLCTLCLYIFTFLAFTLFPKRNFSAICAVTVMCLVYLFVIRWADRYVYWYNTVFTYPAGMFYALYKEKIEKALQKSNAVYFAVLALFLAATGIAHMHRRDSLAAYEIMSVLFVLTLVIVTMKVKIGNPILDFFGKYTFEIYILQRLTFKLAKRFIHNRSVTLAVCFGATILLAIGFKRLTMATDKLIYSKKQN